MCVAGAGLAAIATTYPLDTVRRRLEVAGAPRHLGAARSVARCARQMLMWEGPGSFYKGLLVTCFKSVPSTVLQVRL
jgi:hypothetical protein